MAYQGYQPENHNNHRILRFFGLVFAGSWIPWLALAALRKDAYAMPWFLVFGLGAIFPSAAGLYLTYRESGADGLRSLLRGSFQLGYKVSWYAALILLIPGINICALFVGQLFGGTPPDFSNVHRYLTQPLSLLLLFVTTLLIGPLNEEFGWCGYALRRLIDYRGRSVGNIALGAARLAWHLPMFFMVGTDQSSRPFIPFALGILGLSFLCGWAYEGTGWRIAAPILAHFLFNLSIGTLLPFGNQAYWIRGAFYFAVMMALIAFWEKGSRKYPQTDYSSSSAST